MLCAKKDAGNEKTREYKKEVYTRGTQTQDAVKKWQRCECSWGVEPRVEKHNKNYGYPAQAIQLGDIKNSAIPLGRIFGQICTFFDNDCETITPWLSSMDSHWRLRDSLAVVSAIDHRRV